jgi:hypothetical protein
VTATSTAGGDALEIELWDQSGATKLAPGTPVVGGQQVTFSVSTGQAFLARVGKRPSASAIPYSLSISIQ